jgi:hypothetical protein
MNSAIAMPDSFFTSAARKAAEPSKAIRNMRSMSRSLIELGGGLEAAGGAFMGAIGWRQ